MEELQLSVKETIELIHNEFDGAAEKMLKEAEHILSQGFSIEKEHRLEKLGFGKSKQAQSYSKANDEKSIILHYQRTYPTYKFISEEIAKQVCEKYGLLLGSVSNYEGDVPEKNLREVESFKVKLEDYEKRGNSGLVFNWFETTRVSLMDYDEQWKNSLYGISSKSRRSGHDAAMAQAMWGEYRKKNPEQVKPDFMICAPESDFNTKGKMKDGHKLVEVPDPIVLCPVKGGYLIVSKWGLEASDLLVINENHN